MRRLLILAIALTALSIAGIGFCTDLADVAWTKSNLEQLQSFTAADVAKFMNSGKAGDPPWYGQLPDGDDVYRVSDLAAQDFLWTNMHGDDQYQLVVALPPRGSAGQGPLVIYSKDASAKFHQAEIDGEAIALHKERHWGDYWGSTIQDLNGDGKKELILRAGFGYPTWPVVYRLSDDGENLIECTKAFPKFYQNTVLPELDDHIASLREEAAKEPKNGTYLETTATQLLGQELFNRAKILVISGLDPDAMKKQAQKFMTASDPDYDPGGAARAYNDIGDKENAEKARRVAHQQRDAWRKAHGFPPLKPVP